MEWKLRAALTYPHRFTEYEERVCRIYSKWSSNFSKIIFFLLKGRKEKRQKGCISFVGNVVLWFSVFFVGLKLRRSLEEATDFDPSNLWLANQECVFKKSSSLQGRKAVFQETTERIEKERKKKHSSAFTFNFWKLQNTEFQRHLLKFFTLSSTTKNTVKVQFLVTLRKW